MGTYSKVGVATNKFQVLIVIVTKNLVSILVQVYEVNRITIIG